MAAVEDLDRSRESLLRVLHHHGLRPLFVEFCNAEHNAENVELWLALQRFNAAHATGDSDKQARYAGRIVDTFVRETAPKQVNMREVSAWAPAPAPARSCAARCGLPAQETRGLASTALEREDMASLMTIFEELENIALKELQRDILPRFLTSKQLAEYGAGGGRSGQTPAPPSPPLDSASSKGDLPRPSLLSAIGSAVAAVRTGGASSAAAGGHERDRRRSQSMLHVGARRGGGGRGGVTPRAPSSSDGDGGSEAPASAGGGGSEDAGGGEGGSAREQVAAAMRSGWGVGAEGGVMASGGATAHAGGGPTSPRPHATAAATPETVLALGSKLNKKTRLFGISFKMHSTEDKKAFAEVGEYLTAHCVKAGYLYKRGDKNPTWKRRWVILAPGLLGYFESAADTVPKGVVTLRDITDVHPDAAGELEGLPFTFSLISPHRRFYMQGASERDLARWLQAVTEQWQASLGGTSP